jgi:hypothetical protein
MNGLPRLGAAFQPADHGSVEHHLDSTQMYVEIAQDKPDDPRSLRYTLNAIENVRDSLASDPEKDSGGKRGEKP